MYDRQYLVLTIVVYVPYRKEVLEARTVSKQGLRRLGLETNSKLDISLDERKFTRNKPSNTRYQVHDMSVPHKNTAHKRQHFLRRTRCMFKPPWRYAPPNVTTTTSQ